MMRLRAPGSDDLIAHFLREGDIYQLIAVDVTDLAFANYILHAAEAVRSGCHALPGCDGFCDAFLRAFDTHDFSNRQDAKLAKESGRSPRIFLGVP